MVPAAIWFGDRTDKYSNLQKNPWLWWTWFAIWAGHLTVYAFPGLLWPISFSAELSFNYIFVIW